MANGAPTPPGKAGDNGKGTLAQEKHAQHAPQILAEERKFNAFSFDVMDLPENGKQLVIFLPLGQALIFPMDKKAAQTMSDKVRPSKIEVVEAGDLPAPPQ